MCGWCKGSLLTVCREGIAVFHSLSIEVEEEQVSLRDIPSCCWSINQKPCVICQECSITVGARRVKNQQG